VIRARRFVEAAGEHGLRFYSGVPCSYLTPFIDHVLAADGLRYVGAANEGDALAIGAGAELAGRPSVVMFQNSGLGNAVNPLTSLAWTFKIPLLLVPTWRGEPGGAPDEPQHELMGRVTTRMLELCDVPWEVFPDDEAALPAALERAVAHRRRARRPYALVMRKGTGAADAGAPPAPCAPPRPCAAQDAPAALEPRARRRALLAAVQRAVRDAGGRDVVVATTGYTGRELCALDDRPNQLYLVGSMGCASSVALGLALARPERRVIVLDGDGAALMRLGALAAVGRERPGNLVHVLLDNRVHESTGGQATLACAVDFPAAALALGYAHAARTAEPAELCELLARASPGPSFVHVPMLPGVDGPLPRPALRPDEVAQRLRAFLAEVA
jgi:phosphonopyruvate decarboxylase